MPLSPCSRACCWSPFSCGRQGECSCHWGDWLKTARATGGADRTYRDPTSREAIANVMKEGKR